MKIQTDRTEPIQIVKAEASKKSIKYQTEYHFTKHEKHFPTMINCFCLKHVFSEAAAVRLSRLTRGTERLRARPGSRQHSVDIHSRYTQ